MERPTSSTAPADGDAVDEEVWDLAAANARGADLVAEGHHKEAVAIFRHVHDRCRSIFGPHHVATLTVGGNLAVATVGAGKRRPGMTMLAQNVAARVTAWGDDDPRTLTARDALAVAHRLAGEVDEAVELSAHVTAQRTRTLGPSDPATITSRMGLVQARAAAGDLDSAGVLLSAAMADAEKTLGRRHPSTLALLECGEHLGLLQPDF